MKKISLITGLFILSLNILSQTTVVLKPEADAIVHWKDGDAVPGGTNYGSYGYLRAETWNDGGLYKMRGLVKFDFSGIPANATITNVTLYLYNPNDGLSWTVHSGSNASYLQRITAYWREETVTWNNQPGITTSGQVTVSASTSSRQDYAINSTALTDMVKGWINRSFPNYGCLFILQNEAVSRRLIFATKEFSNTDKHPRLEITYTLPSPGNSVTLYPTKDSYINSYSSYTNTNFYYFTAFRAWKWTSGGVQFTGRSLIEFDLSAIPSNATITAATLTLYGVDHNPLTSSNASYLQRITQVWDKKIVTWNNQPTITSTGQISLPQSTSPTQNYDVNVKDFIQAWVNGTNPNCGLLLRLQVEQIYAKLDFASSDYSDYTKHPKLVITFTTSEIPYSAPATLSTYTVDPTPERNYIHTIIPTVEKTSVLFTGTRNPYEIDESITYFDGLGRTVQPIIVKGSPAGNDVIQPVKYDNFGRNATQYLPYTKASNNGAYSLNAFYEQASFYPSGSYPYSTTVFNQSPLNRVIEQGAPGSYAQPGQHTPKFEYRTNNAYDQVYKWTIGSNYVVTSSCYAVNQLLVTIVKSENWTSGDLNTVQEFRDKSGKVILKRAFVLEGANTVALSTYYVYDDFGLLRCIVPPKTASSAPCYIYEDGNNSYYYKYDNQHRLIYKKVLEVEAIEFVYNKRDMLVAVRDGKLRYDDAWKFIKYDILNRPVLTGRYIYEGSRDDLQTIVDAEPDLYETRGTTVHGYTNVAYPDISDPNKYLTVTYYDDYPTGYSASNYKNVTGFTNAPVARTKGLITGSKTKVLSTSDWITTIPFYDKRERMIQVQTNYTLGTDVISDTLTSEYNFTGAVIKTRQAQVFNSNTNHLNTRYVYDHMGRVLEEYQKVNSEAEILTASYRYNERNELIEKNLHCEDHDNYLQSVDYQYNIRGWLTDINNKTEDASENDLFMQKLYYEDPSELSTLSPGTYYNGNISAMKWRTGNVSSKKMGFGLTYDELGRISDADYGEYTTSWTNPANKYDVSVDGYDKNGNISGLAQYGESGLIDDLSYNYSNFVNKLYNVDDVSGAQGFDDGSTSGSSSQEFSYDQNGNMIEDLNKNIDIEYNLLNLPEKVYFPALFNCSRLSFDYDAAGNKVRMLVEKNCGSQSNPTCTVEEEIHYVGNFVYVDNNLEYILNGHGRITKPSGSFIYEYFITDHLGNARVVFNEEGTSGANPKQYADYYPFGMRFVGTYLNNDNRYLYNSKEWTDDFELEWYDYGARFYDPSLGRWHSVDPSAESSYSQSPYNYVINNPIRYIDPTGGTYLEYMRDTYPEGFWYRGEYQYQDHDIKGAWHSGGGFSASGTGSYTSSHWVMITTFYETTTDYSIEGRYVGTTISYSSETEYKYVSRSINYDQGEPDDPPSKTGTSNTEDISYQNKKNVNSLKNRLKDFTKEEWESDKNYSLNIRNNKLDKWIIENIIYSEFNRINCIIWTILATPFYSFPPPTDIYIYTNKRLSPAGKVYLLEQKNRK